MSTARTLMAATVDGGDAAASEAEAPVSGAARRSRLLICLK